VKLVHLVGFITKKFVRMHGHMNVIYICIYIEKERERERERHTHTHISDCVEIFGICYQIILWVKYFYTNRGRCEVLTGYLSIGRRPGGDWANT